MIFQKCQPELQESVEDLAPNPGNPPLALTRPAPDDPCQASTPSVSRQTHLDIRCVVSTSYNINEESDPA
ncbi:hypothetical protein E2C01_068574 [Portunus trituberculatus]|uniref:Uncharacterized protein n=1 Tax=Portunus trituberculatus TaxID=210409 RepID=A0A5B7HMS0_PORTR|nr:hypothetical protein [Portunus trituberculatus]